MNRIASMFDRYNKDIPVYSEEVRLSDLGNAQPSYTLKGDIYRKGDLCATLKDDSMLPKWRKHDLLLLIKVNPTLLVSGNNYYFVLMDGREIAGKLNDQEDGMLITPANGEFKPEKFRNEEVLDMYFIPDGIKIEDALKERDGSK